MKTGFRDVCSSNNKGKKLLLPVQHLGVLFTMDDRGDLRGVLQSKFSKARLSLTRQNLKTQPETIISISVVGFFFFFTFCINLGFVLHHQHSLHCCCPSSFCSVGHKSTLGFNKLLASAENLPHKAYCK